MVSIAPVKGGPGLVIKGYGRWFVAHGSRLEFMVLGFQAIEPGSPSTFSDKAKCFFGLSL